jgi:MFS superfamily sulfate permease-like transporter
MSTQVKEARAGERTFGRDLLASLVVFLVALPLCMGISVASGAPVATGLVTGIIGGLVVGFISGAPLQVSGPAAGLTVVCAEVVNTHGLPTLGVVVLLAGLMQFAAGILRLGQWFRSVSPAVVHGMLSGIGVLIVSSQLHVMVDDKPRGSGLANLLSIPVAIEKGLPIPDWESKGHRQTRLELLQTFGSLHERQVEIAAHVARLDPHAATKPDEGPTPEQTASLKPFVESQEALVADLQAAREKAEQAALPPAGNSNGHNLPDLLRQARRGVEGALLDLQTGSVPKALQSQQQAAGALRDVLAGLKNHNWAAKVGLATILIIMLWQWLAPKRVRFLPGPLLAIIIVTAIAWGASLPVLYVEVPDRLIDGLTFPSLSVFREVPLLDLLRYGLFMAVIASAETLLCATAVDRMHRGPRTKYDQELAAQGLGNFLCGALGALPMTGVIVRSATNVQAGAHSRMSTILHGLWLLIFVVALGFLLRMIPTAALAGILVYTGFRLIDFRGFAHLWQTSRSEAAILAITVIVIVVEDLLIGVVTGVVLSAIKLLVTFSNLDVTLDRTGDASDEHELVTLKISGAATFLRLPLLADKLEQVPRGAQLHVDFEQLDYIDHSCLELLMSWAKQHEAEDGRLFIDWGQLHARFRGGGPHKRALEETPVYETPVAHAGDGRNSAGHH